MKKKLLLYVMSSALFLALFATGMALPVSAAASATLSVANVHAYPGETVTVIVSLNGVTSGAQITLEYDPEILTPEKIEKGPQCPSGWMVVPSSDLTMGRFVAVSGSQKNDNINGVIARYTYKVKAGAALGSTSLKVTTAIMSDDGTDFNATVSSHGSVMVASTDPTKPTGTTKSTDPTKSTDLTGPTDSGNSTSSSTSGTGSNKPKTGFADLLILWVLIILSGGIAVYVGVVKKQKS